MIRKKKFDVDKKNKIVMSEYEDDINFYDEMNYSTKLAAYLLNGTYKDYSTSNTKFKTIVKCDPSDTFDEKIGKDIAGSLTDYKYHDYIARQYEKAIDEMEEMIEQAKKEILRHRRKCTNIKNSLKRYS